MRPELSLFLGMVVFMLGAFWLAVQLIKAKDALDIEKVKHRVTLMYLERARTGRKPIPVTVSAGVLAQVLADMIQCYDAEKVDRVATFVDERSRLRYWETMAGVMEEAREILALAAKQADKV